MKIYFLLIPFFVFILSSCAEKGFYQSQQKILIGQPGDDRVQHVVHVREEVLVDGDLPARVVVRVRHQVHVDLVGGRRVRRGNRIVRPVLRHRVRRLCHLVRDDVVAEECQRARRRAEQQQGQQHGELRRWKLGVHLGRQAQQGP